jgi:Gamma-glutamyl cyclotransferase, AIG2-like
VRSEGTANYLADAEKGSHKEIGSRENLPGPTVHGELFSFDDPEERLLDIDGLEGFRPGEESLYKRVLIPTMLSETGTTILAWAYAVESASGIYLPSGRWPAPLYYNRACSNFDGVAPPL